VREVLVISSDRELAETLKMKLQGEGFLVSFSESLESSFLEVGRREPFMAIVDGESIPEPLWQARNFLNWLHHRSPVVLLTDRYCEELSPVCDSCLPRLSGKNEILSCIQSLSSH
jgi:hypothetical protein